MVARIYTFPNAEQPPILSPEFEAAFTPELETQTVQAVGKLLDAPHFNRAIDFDVFQFMEQREHGDIRVATSANKMIVGTCPRFPNSLLKHTDLDREQALTIAASMVTAFGLTARAVKDSGVALSRMPVPKKDVWDGRYREDEKWARDVTTYRAAAAVSLAAFKKFPLTFDLPNPLPNHLASLANPFSRAEFRRLYQLFS